MFTCPTYSLNIYLREFEYVPWKCIGPSCRLVRRNTVLILSTYTPHSRFCTIFHLHIQFINRNDSEHFLRADEGEVMSK